jgi:protein TonB
MAQSARVHGVVVIAVTVAPSGHVEAAKVVRSIPLLDEAALAAVRQWVYTPTVIDGTAVPVLMTVTVNFALQ